MKQGRFLTLFKRPLALVVAFTFLTGAGLVYWYGYRPGMVREKCSIEAEKRADNDLFAYEIIYRHCLRTHGIEYFEQKERED